MTNKLNDKIETCITAECTQNHKVILGVMFGFDLKMIDFTKIFEFLKSNPKLTLAGFASVGTVMVILAKVIICFISIQPIHSNFVTEEKMGFGGTCSEFIHLSFEVWSSN